MINVKVPTLFFIVCACVASGSSSSRRGFYHRANHQILATIDAVFITLKINENFTKSKNIADYLSMHNYVQDAVQKNDQIYQRIRSKCKTKFGNKTISFNSNIVEVIEETINKLKVTISENVRNHNERNTTAWTHDELRNSFLKLTKDFHLEINTTLPNDIKLLASDVDSDRPESRRIFMGKPTAISRYPFVASIHVLGRFCCAGALIHDDLVITAASCFEQFVRISPLVRVTYIKVRVGSDYTDKYGELLPIAGLHLHPGFNATILRHNLAIVHLEQQLKLQKNVLISIKFDRTPQRMPTDVRDVLILGWGDKRSSNIKNKKNVAADEKLAFSRLELYDLDECEAIYTRTYVSGKLFCAGFVNRGSGACKNDVGAPAIVGSTLTGVTSFGAPRCGQRDTPTVFTKLGFYTTWIDSIYAKIHKVNPSLAVAYDLNLELQRESVDKKIPKQLYFEDARENDNSPKQIELDGYDKNSPAKKLRPKNPPVLVESTNVDYGKFVFEMSSSTTTTRRSKIRGNQFTKINERPPHSSEEKIIKTDKDVIYVSEDQVLKYYRKRPNDKAELAIRESGTTQRYVLDKKIPSIQRGLENLKKLFAHYIL